MKVRQLLKMCNEFGLGLDDEIVLWTWTGKASRFQWLNLTCQAFSHKGYVVLMPEPYADDIVFRDADKKVSGIESKHDSDTSCKVKQPERIIKSGNIFDEVKQ